MLKFEALRLNTQSVISLSVKTLLKHVDGDVELETLGLSTQNLAGATRCS
jgi:hypothetical protein